MTNRMKFILIPLAALAFAACDPAPAATPTFRPAIPTTTTIAPAPSTTLPDAPMPDPAPIAPPAPAIAPAPISPPVDDSPSIADQIDRRHADNGDGRCDEDETCFDCATMGNMICDGDIFPPIAGIDSPKGDMQSAPAATPAYPTLSSLQECMDTASEGDEGAMEMRMQECRDQNEWHLLNA